MNCPRCTSSSLTEMDRDGITIDRCERCRGIWLDRGELEKLIARSQEDERPSRRRDDDDFDDHEDSDSARHRGQRRRSWFDIFD